MNAAQPTMTPNRPVRIPRADLPADTVALARYLLGLVLVREINGVRMTGRIVETEAYLPDDPACHAYRGPTPRNQSLFLERGHAYVYLCYGTSYLLNMSSETQGIGAGVLLRALEPLEGLTRLQARGPGRLTAALQVDRRHDGLDLLNSPHLWIGSDGQRAGTVGQSVRIGLSKGVDERLRFFVAGSACLSGPRKLNVVAERGSSDST